MNDGTKWLTWNNLQSGVRDNWWRVKFPSYSFKSYLPFRFWKSAFVSGITASPIKDIKYDASEADFCKFSLDKTTGNVKWET